MFRFTIRDLLWLMVVVGLSVGWSSDHKEARQAKQLREEVKELSSAADDAIFDASMIASWIDPQAESLSRGKKERLWKKYEKESRLIPRFNK